MNKTQLHKYVNIVKQQSPNLTEEMIEKDYYLSLFLTLAEKLKKDAKLKEFGNLIFKGGTLLTKHYLNYHRISEDLDFTYANSTDIRKLSTNKAIDKTIKVIQYNLIEDLKKICSSKFIFLNKKQPSLEYINVRNKRVVCCFHLYYNSLYSSNKLSNIKIEVNFVEEIINKQNINKLFNIANANNLELKSLDFDLKTVELMVYPINEIILEKYRAIFTRKIVKERDFFDLYLIDKKYSGVLTTNNKLIKEKIESAFRFFPNTIGFYNDNLKQIKDHNLEIKQDISNLAVIPYDKIEFELFKSKIISKLSSFEQIK